MGAPWVLPPHPPHPNCTPRGSGVGPNAPPVRPRRRNKPGPAARLGGTVTHGAGILPGKPSVPSSGAAKADGKKFKKIKKKRKKGEETGKNWERRRRLRPSRPVPVKPAPERESRGRREKLSRRRHRGSSPTGFTGCRLSPGTLPAATTRWRWGVGCHIPPPQKTTASAIPAPSRPPPSAP